MRFCKRSTIALRMMRREISYLQSWHSNQRRKWIPRTASPWAQKRAGAAITLLRQGERESIFDVFRYQDDPEAAKSVCGPLPRAGHHPSRTA